ncbi:MAG: AN1-type zinc finger domain-containing protein [Candidatus Peribacteraceae bacterium]|nr:AN1-type zinc finger domain-containing protein [Candidatus Peribacteraceae bacterium]
MLSIIEFKLNDSLGRGKSNVVIEIRKIDDYFYSDNPKRASTTTDKDGIGIIKSVSHGKYLASFNFKKTNIEKILLIDGNDKFEIKIPIFGLFKKDERFDDKEIEKIYDENRTDLDKCFKCKKKYKTYTDRFKCNYCNKFFCPKHRLPESHNCWGKLVSKSGAFREVHYANGSVVAGG